METLAYFKIGNRDYSNYVNKLKISEKNIYNSQTNAAGNTVVDFINKKRTIEVGIIPMYDTVLADLMADLEAFNVSISFINPKTTILEENVNCIIPDTNIEYYTIQVNKTMTKAFSLKFTEL